MWSWQAPTNETRAPRGSVKPDFYKSSNRSLDTLENYCAYDVRSHYKQLKENHPYYQEQHKLHQAPIKMSYLESLQKAPF